MDSSKESFGKSSCSDYLHYNYQKFWEITAFNNNKVLIRCGRLESDRKEDSPTIQSLEKAYNSTDEQTQAVRKFIDIKLSKGYKYFEETREQAKDKIEGSLKRESPEMFEGDTITKQVKLDPLKKGSSDQKKEDREFVQQELILSRSQKEHISNIEKGLDEEKLFYELWDDKLYVLGPQKPLATIKDLLRDLEQNSGPVDPNSEEVEMKVDSKIMKDVQKKGDQFISYIEKKVEHTHDHNEEPKGRDGDQKIEKKSLYPDLWEFSEIRSFCKINSLQQDLANPNNEERYITPPISREESKNLEKPGLKNSSYGRAQDSHLDMFTMTRPTPKFAQPRHIYKERAFQVIRSPNVNQILPGTNKETKTTDPNNRHIREDHESAWESRKRAEEILADHKELHDDRRDEEGDLTQSDSSSQVDEWGDEAEYEEEDLTQIDSNRQVTSLFRSDSASASSFEDRVIKSCRLRIPYLSSFPKELLDTDFWKTCVQKRHSTRIELGQLLIPLTLKEKITQREVQNSQLSCHFLKDATLDFPNNGDTSQARTCRFELPDFKELEDRLRNSKVWKYVASDTSDITNGKLIISARFKSPTLKYRVEKHLRGLPFVSIDFPGRLRPPIQPVKPTGASRKESRQRILKRTASDALLKDTYDQFASQPRTAVKQNSSSQEDRGKTTFIGRNLSKPK